MNTLRKLTLLTFFTVTFCHTAFALAEEGMIKKAQLLWEQYYTLERSFDSAAADLYADTALIKNTRRYPNGTSKDMVIDARQYKDLIRSSMGLAKARGDTNEYSTVTYAVEKEQVRIKAVRFSNLKQYESPLELLVGPNSAGQWIIFEEISVSQP